MRIGLYIIGDEILSGKRQDRHLANISGLLGKRGLQLSWVKLLGDDLETLVEAFRHSFNSNDLVFSCGGIGGTPDDLTRRAVADSLDIDLEFHPEGLKILQSRARFFDGGITEQRKRMIEFPVGARLIPNPVNKVPGFSVHRHYFVPGFPKMAQPMIQWVLENEYPNLDDKNYREWSLMLYKVPESDIADLMEELQQEYSVKAFSLPKLIDEGYQVELGIKGNLRNVERAADKLVNTITNRGYSFDLS